MLDCLIGERKKSKKIYAQSCDVIASGVNSPVRGFANLSMDPLIVQSGYQDEIVDADGNRYLDYCQSWGALICGHCHPTIVEAAQMQVARGSTFGIATQIEQQLAAKICTHVQSMESLRFVSSGTEATMSAIRVARGFTKKEYIVKFTGNYHGHSDQLLVQAGSGVAELCSSASSAGLAPDAVRYTLCLPFNCIDSIKRLFRDPVMANNIAAVIVEPVAANMGVVAAMPAFLEQLRVETERVGSLLIFDEVISGFRVGLGGAQELYGVYPDLTCLGKIVGGGYPAAAFGARREIMDQLAPKGDVYQAGTLSGNPVAMAAALKTLELCEKEGFYKNLQEKTDLLTKPINAFIEEKGINACIAQCGSLFTLFFGTKRVRSFEDTKGLDLEMFKSYYHFMFSRGIYLSPSQFEANFVSSAHTEEHLLKTKDAILEFLTQNGISSVGEV